MPVPVDTTTQTKPLHALQQIASDAAPWSRAKFAAIRECVEAIDLTEDPAFAELSSVFGRIALLTEVGECLDANSEAELGRFLEDAIEQLVGGLSVGNPTDIAAKLIEESWERWGEYLVLVDPACGSAGSRSIDGVDEGNVAADADSAIDASALMQLFGVATSGPEPPPVGQTATKVTPRSERPQSASSAPERATAIPTGAAVSDALPPLLVQDAELRDAFLMDASDLFQRIQDIALAPGSLADTERLQELSRCLHTLKGATASVGLDRLASAVHALEDRLTSSENSSLANLEREIHGLTAQIEDTLTAVRKAASPHATESRPSSATKSQPVAAGRPDAPPAAAAGVEESDGVLRVPARKLDDLVDIAAELLARRRLWLEQAAQVRQFGLATRACAGRLRGVAEGLRAHDGPSPTASRLSEEADDLALLSESTRSISSVITDEGEALSRTTLRLWEALQTLQIVPVRGVLRRLVRVAREAAELEGRQIEVSLLGEDTGADRSTLERAYEPLLHVVRNAVGHGIEPPDARVRAGKPASGRITLQARREAGAVSLSVEDDGNGLDYDAILAKGRRLGLVRDGETPTHESLKSLIFQSGFSTRNEANELAGRGVGMDVVAREVARLRGSIHLDSERGRGTRLTVRLPSRLALTQTLIVRVGALRLGIPIDAVDAVCPARDFAPRASSDGTLLVDLAGRAIPWIDPRTILALPPAGPSACPIVLIVKAESGSFAARFDAVDGHRELIVRPLGLLAGHPAIAGTSLTTGGDVVLLADPNGMAALGAASSTSCGASVQPVSAPHAGLHALVVDDSLSVRRVASRYLRNLGFEVHEASDGREALAAMRTRTFQLILSDLEMPRMDGFELLAELGRNSSAPPVIVTSTLSDPVTRSRVAQMGAIAFLPKPVDAELLGRLVERIAKPSSKAILSDCGADENAMVSPAIFAQSPPHPTASP